MSSTIFGSFKSEQQVTVNSNQQVLGRKAFLNAGNEYTGTFVDPTITVNGVSITSTEISYLEDLAGNIQDQLDDKLDITGGTLTNSVVIDNGAGDTITAGSNQIDFTSTAINPSVISNSSGQDMNIVSTGNLNLSASINIDAVAPNFNCNGSAMPICFTIDRADTIIYSLGGQTLEQVYSTSFSIPQAFVAESPFGGYTSTIWKIDFALNTWDNSVTGDTGIALFFTLEDAGGYFPMTPQTYNATTPYAVYQPSSTYVAGGNSAFQNYNWTDWIDLAPLVGQGSGVLPLTLLLKFAANSAFTCNFQMTITLTRTNLV